MFVNYGLKTVTGANAKLAVDRLACMLSILIPPLVASCRIGGKPLYGGTMLADGRWAKLNTQYAFCKDGFCHFKSSVCFIDLHLWTAGGT